MKWKPVSRQMADETADNTRCSLARRGVARVGVASPRKERIAAAHDGETHRRSDRRSRLPPQWVLSDKKPAASRRDSFSP